jgi:beta-glucosidase
VILTIVNYRISNPDPRWNWDKIKTEKIYFPNNFMWGTATAAHQVEGNNTNNNWYRFEHQKDSSGKPRIHNNDKSGLAADHWNRYKEDIDLMNELGVKYYRFSIEWSKIEPKNGIFNEKALEHYRELCTTLIDSGLTPVVTLHHFTHPIWFEDLGGFEKEENIKHYLEFSEFVFNKLSDLVPFWCTINEPAVYVSQGYFNGVFPPGKKDPVLAGQVMKNLLNAHVAVFRHLKTLPNGMNVQIGLVKNITQFDPLRRWHILDWYFSGILNDIFTNNTIDLLTTGNFNFYLPGMANISYKNTDAIGAIDFIGLNYYSRWHVKGHLNTATPFTFETRPEDIQTDMPYSIYPEGFYRAIQTISKLNKPIIITENGIADNKDDRRELFIERYLYALYKAIMDGYDIRGYFYWTLMDNFEWAEGYAMKFGLYEVDFTTQKRELRKGSLAFSKIVKQPGADKRGYIVSVGDQAPDLLLEYTNGKTVQLSDLLGQVVVLQFTASWCSVCIQEMPHLEKEVWNAYKDKGLMLIGIDRDEPLDVVEKFQEKVGTTYPIALDPGAKHFSKFAHINSGVTRNIVIDKNGKIAFLTRLFDKEEFQAMINKIDLLIQE